tara:strand:+ start:2094 stop:2747 length:654 start_codon:yes stop_codon:yes gene_type:complete
MGYLDNSSITVDAILTKKGRELLAKGDGSFQITKFALSDDEVDYNLWNSAHELGSNYYGTVIENMPVVEASPNQQHVMKYKLVTLPQNTQKLPIISIGSSAIGPLDVGQQVTITPTTPNLPGSNTTAGYTAVVADTDIVNIAVVGAAAGGPSSNASYAIPSATGTIVSNAATVVGTSFRLTAKSIASAGSTTLTITGNETGGTTTIAVSVNLDTNAS